MSNGGSTIYSLRWRGGEAGVMALPDGHVDRGLVVPCSPLPFPFVLFFRYNRATSLYGQRPCDIMLFFWP